MAVDIDSLLSTPHVSVPVSRTFMIDPILIQVGIALGHLIFIIYAAKYIGYSRKIRTHTE